MIDFDHIGSFLFEAKPVDPTVIVPDQNKDELPETPPAVSGYREADVQGVSCWNCGHFLATGDDDNDGVIDGICNLWETQADGESVCDRFTAHADLLRQSPHTSWAEDLTDAINQEAVMGPSIASVNYSDDATLNELFLSGSQAVEEDGLVWKDILRTGNWSHTPTNKGIIKSKLQIIRDGVSDPSNGIISLSELLANFEARAVPYVTVPLSDDNIDHKNIARLNTGLVQRLKLVDRDGISYLRAGIGFTEPEIKEKVLRGTIPDVSAGVPFGVTRRRDNKFFSTVLDHVCLTSKPFIDGLSPFGLAAADEQTEPLPVEAWEEEEIIEAQPQPEHEVQPESKSVDNEAIALTFQQQRIAIGNALVAQLRLSPDYEVEDINSDLTVAIVHHKSANMKWEVPFKLTLDPDTPVKLAGVDHWKAIEENQDEQQTQNVEASSINKLSELQRVRELRELRLAQPASKTGGIHMSITAPSLEGVELSDEARSRVQEILDENARLHKTNQESKVNDRISELEGLGLKERPGALKFYREIMLSDDGGLAIVLFADSDDENKKERLTALDVLDRFIEALKADGGVVLSDQHFESGNDNKPPNTPEGEGKSKEERVKDANVALYGNPDGPRKRRRQPQQA